MTQAVITPKHIGAFAGAVVGAGEIIRALVGVCRHSSGMIFMSIVDLPRNATKNATSRFIITRRDRKNSKTQINIQSGTLQSATVWYDEESNGDYDMHSQQPGMRKGFNRRNKKQNKQGRSGGVFRMNKLSGGSISG